MSRHLDRPAACAVAVSVVAAVAALLPGTARADDTLETPLAPVASLTDAVPVTTDPVATTAGPEVAAVVEALAGAEPVPALDPAPVASPEPVSAPTPAATTEAAVPTADPEPTSGAEPTGDITAAEGDIAPDTPAVAPEPASTSPATPTPSGGSANINVSVRIDSPGDNGAVTQLNAPAASVPLNTSSEQTPRSAAGTTSTAQQDTMGISQDPVTTASGEWYWNWDCLGATPVTAISPTLSGSGSLPSSWTWNWNCGDNGMQYHNETASGYRQINTNISIRISSPGNDGRVAQVNVGAGVTIPLPAPLHGVPSPPSSPLVLRPAETLLGIAFELAGPGPTAVSVDTTAVLPGAALIAPVGIAVGLEPEGATPPDVAALVPFAPGLRAQRSGLTWPDTVTAKRATGAGATATSAALGAWHAPAEATPAAEHGAAKDRSAKASPRRPSQLPDRAPLAPVSSASAAAAGVGGSSGSGLPVLLILPFVAALLDLARRVALEHATWPPGHRRRAPDRPG